VVAQHTVTVGFRSEAESGQWLAVDDVRFFKPLPDGAAPPEPRPFQPVQDPIWSLLAEPMTFGDGRFLFFGREVGRGDAITVRADLQPSARREQVALERMPLDGEAGWSLRLGAAGELTFRLGTAASHTDVTVPAAYEAGQLLRVTCVFDHGTATVFLDGKPAAIATGIPQRPLDRTAAGTVGVHRTSTNLPYRGALARLRIHNRALTPAELAVP
jgi:hypothetical protein